MRILLAILCIVMAVPAAALACDDCYWQHEEVELAACTEKRTGCMVLQTVMLGSFRELDVEDNLSKRVMSAALAPLCQVTDDDIAHFCAQFEENEADVRELYYAALSNCLLADIMANPAEGNAATGRTVLLLFLKPDSMLNSQEQMDAIRAELTDRDCGVIAEACGLPVRYVKYLLTGDDTIIESESPQ